jgi:L-2-hydroxyglutarate oxidase LhgO
LKRFAKILDVPINHCGKVVVSKNQDEAERLRLLHLRGASNGVEIELLPSHRLDEFEPTAKTTDQFIWSPTTAVLNPKILLQKLGSHFEQLGGKIVCNANTELRVSNDEVYVVSNGRNVDAVRVINAAGSYSDSLAHQIGLGANYGALPFRGSYRKSQQRAGSKSLIYPVPHPINPFLGIHTTITSDGFLKIGPTAIPALGRENYRGLNGIKLHELVEISRALRCVAKGSKYDIFEIIRMELPLLFKRILIENASRLTNEISKHSAWEKTESGIRSQLVDLRTGELTQDFIVERYSNSLHFLNVVSPGWTSALPFTRHFVNEFLNV